ncbi:hypothetical protein F4809DRAFT_597008 [Biscogniauxia mediterranea]|nr:hypothetical protein F4809DRAFT_597008 [Biscogniauxia mediterranea]
MDWTPDRTGLSERDLARVFKYASGRTTIIKTTREEKKLYEYTFTDMDWERDLQKIVPSPSESNPGLVIMYCHIVHYLEPFRESTLMKQLA